MRPHALPPLFLALLLASCDGGVGDYLDSLTVTDTAGCVIRSPDAASLGRAYCWGDGNTLAMQRPLLGPVALLRWGHPSCIIGPTGRAACWGTNEAGELGNGSFQPSDIPRQVVGLSAVLDLQVSRFVPTTVTAFSVVVEPGFACALDAESILWCWGYNGSGQLGNGTLENRAVPVQPFGLGEVASYALGPRHACAIDVDGALACWGLNASGQVGDGTFVNRTQPTPVSLPAPAVSVALGEAHTCAALDDGAVYCWGANDAAQLGLGHTGPALALPHLVEAIDGVSLLASGRKHVCGAYQPADALQPPAVACWGANDAGQSGATPNGFPAFAPVDVAGLTTVISLALGTDHSCALVELTPGGEREVRCWGANDVGQSGAPFPVARAIPSVVRGL